MKRLLVVLLFVFGLGPAVFAQESVVPNMDPNAPDIKFEAEILDYGLVDYDANGLREFKFTNIGRSPLTISSVSGRVGNITLAMAQSPCTCSWSSFAFIESGRLCCSMISKRETAKAPFVASTLTELQFWVH